VRRAIAPGIALALALGAVGRARADEPPDAVRVPIVVVDQSRAVSEQEVDAIAEGLGAPVLRGVELARALDAGAGSGAQQARARFEVAKDSFFAGDHQDAGRAFDEIVSAIEGDPCATTLAPELARIGFESRLFLAIVAHGDGDEAEVERLLDGAARQYPGLAPEPAEFPPWICEAHGRAADRQAPVGEDGPERPAGCALVKGDPPLSLTVGRADLRLLATADDGPEDVAAAAAGIARAGGWPRVVVVVGRSEGIEVLLVDAGTGRPLRTGPPLWAPPADLTAAPAADEPRAERPWYRNGLAWAVTGIGLAAAGTGFALGRAYGSPSPEEPIAWSLMAAGAGVATTGVVLFFVPAPAGADEDNVALGVSAAVRF